MIAPGHTFRFKNPLYSVEARAIDLCLSLTTGLKSALFSLKNRSNFLRVKSIFYLYKALIYRYNKNSISALLKRKVYNEK